MVSLRLRSGCVGPRSSTGEIMGYRRHERFLGFFSPPDGLMDNRPEQLMTEFALRCSLGVVQCCCCWVVLMGVGVLWYQLWVPVRGFVWRVMVSGPLLSWVVQSWPGVRVLM